MEKNGEIQIDTYKGKWAKVHNAHEDKRQAPRAHFAPLHKPREPGSFDGPSPAPAQPAWPPPQGRPHSGPPAAPSVTQALCSEVLRPPGHPCRAVQPLPPTQPARGPSSSLARGLLPASGPPAAASQRGQQGLCPRDRLRLPGRPPRPGGPPARGRGCWMLGPGPGCFDPALDAPTRPWMLGPGPGCFDPALDALTQQPWMLRPGLGCSDLALDAQTWPTGTVIHLLMRTAGFVASS
ncbi:proline-rich protein 2-like [Vulpes lagopus]|uniref:proline-rich protein 2-like n=1 Tax=Vulpes lagopus TaxID=494514 RepID=UPI001BC9FE44|nr:proline-rich protein 2-like [Vulpes lagopus]